MKKLLFSALALGIAAQAFAALPLKRSDASAVKAWPQIGDCSTCRQVLIDIEPRYIEKCGREISDAETPGLLAQPWVRKMQDIRNLDRLLKLKDLTLNDNEKHRYMSYLYRFNCVSKEAEATSDTPPKPVE
ncbi:hypothetical protein [Undibacterium sp. TC9W]|uniref:hypothetical protein n=1 Tax=Undibacterium sp. TC9W TaxID=3413053 RepID=UPI003BF25815